MLRFHPAVILRLALSIALLFTILGCEKPDGEEAPSKQIVYLASIHPLGEILRELTAGRAEVRVLLSAASSAHTYEPRPSDAREAARAKALFFVAPGLDEWATKLAARKRIKVLDMFPAELLIPMGEHHHEDDGHDHAHHDHDHSGELMDPHFWTDPLMVKALLGPLAESLTKLDPEGAAVYTANATRFAAELDALHLEAEAELAPVAGAKVILFHPSFQYLLKRYGLVYAGVIEQFPGKEATPRYLEEVTALLRSEGIKALFTEPQLSPRSAEVIARETGVAIAQLDPYGGLEGTETYAEFLRYNTTTLRKALE